MVVNCGNDQCEFMIVNKIYTYVENGVKFGYIEFKIEYDDAEDLLFHYQVKEGDNIIIMQNDDRSDQER